MKAGRVPCFRKKSRRGFADLATATSSKGKDEMLWPDRSMPENIELRNCIYPGQILIHGVGLFGIMIKVPISTLPQHEFDRLHSFERRSEAGSNDPGLVQIDAGCSEVCR